MKNIYIIIFMLNKEDKQVAQNYAFYGLLILVFPFKQQVLQLSL